MKRVRLLRKWLKHTKGDLLTVTEDQAAWLCKDREGGQIGQLEGDLYDPDTTETATAPATVEQAVMPRGRSNKQKRRKVRRSKPYIHDVPAGVETP